MASNLISQHKRMAMGTGPVRAPGGQFAKGGSIPNTNLKTGIPDSPQTKAKMANGIPGLKKGGRAGGC
jgi:hypothetical protein